MTRLWALLSVAFVAAIVVLTAAGAVGADQRPPRIVSAVMEDANGNARVDRVRITYSERVRHRPDRDGRYPFAVAGYRIRAIGPTSSRVLLIQLVERGAADQNAHPALRYRRTRTQPVRDLGGNEAVAQLFVRTRARASASGPTPPQVPLDADNDGTPDTADCRPGDASIHPGAADIPDLGFVDSNCDGIDGTETDAVFAADTGSDANPGTKTKPKREIQAAIQAASAAGKRYVLVAFGDYNHVQLVTGISIYGGYNTVSWKREDRYPDGLPLIIDCPEGVLALGVEGVTLQHLKLRGQSCGATDRTAYGIRAVNSTDLTLQRTVVTASDGAPGAAGVDGRTGANGGPGSDGERGSIAFGDEPGRGGTGGLSPTAGHRGGAGGRGGGNADGQPGSQGLVGTRGGTGGEKAEPGKPGAKGDAGEVGLAGSGGAGGSGAAAAVAPFWLGQSGASGRSGTSGNGGGGGGGGGGGNRFGAGAESGDGGGGGGGGGDGGRGGAGGGFGGGSFGIYLVKTTVTVTASMIVTGNGGRGGSGGDGGFGGAGGAGGKGSTYGAGKTGAGGDGGHGGAGGRGGGGGGGAGGPSIGVFDGGTSIATVKDGTTITTGSAGAGGTHGSGGPGGEGGDGAAGRRAPLGRE